MVVHFCWLAACDCNQLCSRIFYDALWVEVWKATLHKLVGIHDYLLFSEYPHHSAIKGEKMLLLTVAHFLQHHKFYV